MEEIDYDGQNDNSAVEDDEDDKELEKLRREIIEAEINEIWVEETDDDEENS